MESGIGQKVVIDDGTILVMSVEVELGVILQGQQRVGTKGVVITGDQNIE